MLLDAATVLTIAIGLAMDVFGLLLIMGCKMIYGVPKPKHKREGKKLNHGMLFHLPIATGIDALAVVLSFAFLKVSIATPLIFISAGDKRTSIVCKLHAASNRIEISGGLILIGIGIKSSSNILLKILGVVS